MIDWLTILIALAIIAILTGVFTIMAWKINMPDPIISTNSKKDESNQLTDSMNEKKKRDKHGGNDQSKKKRKDQKKVKRENKEDEDEDQQQSQQLNRRHSVQFKEASVVITDDSDNEREESEQESSVSPAPQVVETSSRARRRNKIKARQSTPPPSATRIEGILANKDEKSPVTTRPQIIPHPKLAIAIPKDEVELAKQHQQQAKVQVKSSQASNKQTIAPATVKKTITPVTNVNQEAQKQQQEQPFTTVGYNRHKAGTPPLQQQPNKSVNTTSSTTPLTVVSTQQQQPPVQVQHEQLSQRQPPRQQKETPTQSNGFNTNVLPVKQQATVATAAAATSPAKLADLVKALPTSQAVVTELMSALDAFPLSTDELDIIMHKIANKQAVIKQDWTKLQHGQKVDPQAHIGQVMDESAKAYEEDMKNNAMKRIRELTDELNNEKRRINDLLKEKNDKDINIQYLHAQLESLQHKQQPTQLHPQQQQQFQGLQLQLQRLTEDNMQLNQRLAQQQQQQAQLSSLNLHNNNNNDSTNVQVRVFSEQMKKLSVDNANLEKKATAHESLVKQVQKEKDDLIRSNQQLAQKAQEIQKQSQLNEEKLLKESKEAQTLYKNQLNEHQRRINQLTADNEQLQRVEIVHIEPNQAPPPSPPTLNNEEREKFEEEINQLKQKLTEETEQYKQKLNEETEQNKQKLTEEAEQYKQKLDEIQIQQQTQENELRQEIERLKQDKNVEQRQQEEAQNNDLLTRNAQIDALRVELEEAKARNDSTISQLDERLRQGQDQQKQFLTELLAQDVRNQLPNDTQDFNQWLSSYRQIFESSIESNKRALQDESEALKRENDQLHKNMNDVESQLKEIEQTVQSKEEMLLSDLKSKDATLECIHSENEQLNGEMQRLRAEIDRLQLAHDAAVNESHALKLQLDERILVNTSSPSTVADDSFEFVKQPSPPPPPPPEIDTRAEQLNELIRSGKEALENQDSLVQQLDKHLSDMHRGGTGETSNLDELNVSSTSDQQQQQQQPPPQSES